MIFAAGALFVIRRATIHYGQKYPERHSYDLKIRKSNAKNEYTAVEASRLYGYLQKSIQILNVVAMFTFLQ